MRRALLILLAVAACAVPSGEEPLICDAQWLEIDAVIVRDAGVEERTVPVDCYRRVAARRVRLGFTLPPGPTCWHLSRVDLVESADAAEITLRVARHDEPAAGACPEEPTRVVTELDLQAPIGDRRILDGSAG